MSAYVYAVVPYQRDEKVGVIPPWKEKLKNLDCEFDLYCYDFFEDFLLINTCYKMGSLINFNKEGRCWLRDEVYKVVKACHVNEAWYVEELCTEEMDPFSYPDFSFGDWKEKLKNERAYCTIEYNKEVAKSGRLASYMHDTFSDID